MKDYLVQLKAIGSMTQVPDSQKLFGALVYMFAETYGNGLATALTKAVKENTIHLALSNVLPKGYLPTPHDFLIDNMTTRSEKNEISSENEANDNLKEIRKTIKVRDYITSDAISDVLKDPASCKDVYPYIKQQNHQQLRALIDSTRYQIPELDSRLYSVPTVALIEVKKENSEKKNNTNYKKIYKEVKDFCFYLQIDDSELCTKFYNMLTLAINETIILGKRASQGLNLFEIEAVTESITTCSNPLSYLNTGMFLPNKINYEKSFMKLFTSERRPFEKFSGWQDSIKYYISFLAEGSLLTLSDQQNVSKSIESPFRKRDIVFGNAYLYPLSFSLKTREEHS